MSKRKWIVRITEYTEHVVEASHPDDAAEFAAKREGELVRTSQTVTVDPAEAPGLWGAQTQRHDK